MISVKTWHVQRDEASCPTDVVRPLYWLLFVWFVHIQNVAVRVPERTA